MKTQPLTKSKYDYPPRQRRLMVHSWFIILFGIMLALMFLIRCSPKNGCRATRKMSGYSWIKCKETSKVTVMDMKGNIICSYIDTEPK